MVSGYVYCIMSMLYDNTLQPRSWNRAEFWGSLRCVGFRFQAGV